MDPVLPRSSFTAFRVNEPIKRQYLWNEDAVNISDQQASKITSTGTQKEVICPAPERSFGRPNTVARRNSPKERIGEVLLHVQNSKKFTVAI